MICAYQTTDLFVEKYTDSVYVNLGIHHFTSIGECETEPLKLISVRINHKFDPSNRRQKLGRRSPGGEIDSDSEYAECKL